MTTHIPVKKLAAIYVVFAEDGQPDVWGTNVTVDAVRKCIADGKVESRPYQTALTDEDYDHAARVAYLCLNRDLSPIELDVGIPSMSYFNFVLPDGNHRLAASIVMEDETIPASVAGETNYIEHLFVAPRPEYADI